MLITNSNTWEPGYRQRTIKKEVKLGPVSVKFITIAIIACGALFYLAQSTQASSQKYEIMQLNDVKKQLETKSKDLEIEAVRLKSLNEIKTTSQTLGMESVEQN